MKISTDTVQTMTDIPSRMSIQDTQEAMQNVHLQELREHIIRGWTSNRNEFKQDIRLYWTFREKLLISEGVAMKGKRISIQAELQTQALEHHSNQIGMETTRLYISKGFIY